MMPAANLLEEQTKFQANLLHGAAKAGNEQAVTVILDIMKNEGFFNNISVLMAGNHQVIPALIQAGYGEQLATATRELEGADSMAAQVAIMGAQKQGHVEFHELPSLLENGEGGSSSQKPGLNIMVLDDDGRAVTFNVNGKTQVVSVSPKFVEENAATQKALKEKEELETKRVQEREEHQAQVAEDQDEEGIPQKKELVAAHKTEHIPVPEIRQKALMGGYYATNIIDNKQSIKYLMLMLPGIDYLVEKETVDDVVNNHEMAWTTAYFAASLAMSYGANVNLDLSSSIHFKNAALNTLGYTAKKFFQMSPNRDELPPPSDRSVYDFATRFGPAMGQNAAMTLLRAGVMIYITGATMGAAGVAVPVMMSVGTDFLSYYDMYSKGEPQENVASWDNHVVPFLIASLTTLSYYGNIGQHYLAGVDPASMKMQMAQNFFGAMVTFTTSHQLSSLFYENFMQPIGNKVSGMFSGMYEKIFGKSEPALPMHQEL